MVRSQSPKFLSMLLAALILSSTSAVGAETAKSADAPARSGRDNSGKQLAMATPRASKDKVSARKDKGDTVEGAIVSVREQLVDQLKSHNISVPVPVIDIPDDMEQTCDNCYRAVKTAVTFASEHSAQFGGWFARYVKQLTSPPAMTPCASPYSMDQKLVPSNIGQHSSKLFLTNDGRLKTVISR